MVEHDDGFLKTLETIAPGTVLREGLENVLRARTGGLIVVAENPMVMSLRDGGFEIDADFTPSNLYELAKMDGAIILSHNAKRILYANTQLVPDHVIISMETGTRHRTAERLAKQTGDLVIAISQRRNVITLYKGNRRYVLQDTNVILAKANQAIQTLEKYRKVLEQVLSTLTTLEFEDGVTVTDVVKVIQRAEMVLRVVHEIEHYVSELGVEGRLIRMQMEELVTNVFEEYLLVIRDYWHNSAPFVYESKSGALNNWLPGDLLDLGAIADAMGYTQPTYTLDTVTHARGYRVLRKIPRLPLAVVENLVREFANLQCILGATIEELDDVEGIGEVRARSIKEGLSRLSEQVILERHL